MRIRRRRWLATIAALAALQALLLGLWWLSDRRADRSDRSGAAANAATNVAPHRTIRLDEPATALELRHRDGTITQLASRRGRPFVLHFWASWCPPCREELPALLAFGTSPDGLPVVAVSLDDDWAAVEHLVGPGRRP